MSRCQIVSIDILAEFLEIAFHGILYIRNLYPQEIFTKKKIYSTGIFISEHPEINEYIRNVIQTIRELLLQSEESIKKINFVFLDKEKKPLETFVFDLYNFRLDGREKDSYFLKTEMAMREFYLKLMASPNYLKKLPEDSSFIIEIETHEAAHIGLSENEKCQEFPWLIKELSDNSNNTTANLLLPLSTFKTEYLGLQVFVVTSDNQR
ncbi:mitotic spindle assembly checkpoint protein MAD2B [Chelonus insularis]|uniref:mitotic spindle assembly checkpoint protein MAD2B n=1 Tax=Chelonus insularis TaxID=460826 RepID=UPI00158CEFB6|nr:mitotic spindle assembly checkpoint protein MAD2B [Chelonus insularis]XP_034947754.1 mitotic spindle assembly checkpoint protein MAD2B [Chelonus insularis]XP_034947755.1 mitotic spindle assembly checkpoint protein MAD2B [Chelonus insularis]